MHNKRFWLGYLLGVALALVGSGVAVYQKFVKPPKISLGDLELLDLEGHPFAVAQLRGRAVVLNCWATWCVGCVAEFSAFESVQRQQRQPPVFLMASDEPAVKIRSFLRKHPYPFTFVRLKKRLPNLNVLPVTYFYNAQGQMRATRIGEMQEAELREQLRLLTD